MIETPARPRTLGLILAGGLARRMGGGDKALLPLAGRSLLARIIERVAPQCTAGLVLNANGDPARFESFGLPVRPDSVPGFESLSWHGFFTPAKVPPAIVARLHDEVAADLGDALDTPLRRLGVQVEVTSAKAGSDHITLDARRVHPLSRSASLS